jgi:hypothetical protein
LLEHAHYSGLDQIHIMLALVIMVAYMVVPFTALRKLPLPPVARVAGLFFFATCAITHLALAAGFHGNDWMIANDLVQAVSVVTFIVSVSRMVQQVLERREARLAGVGADPLDPGPDDDELPAAAVVTPPPRGD